MQSFNFSYCIWQALRFNPSHRCNRTITISHVLRLYSEEGKDNFTVRHNVLGHMQQGGYPSPFDRSMGTKMAARAIVWLTEMLNHCASADGKYNYFRFLSSIWQWPPWLGSVFAEDQETACVLGVRSREIRFQPVEQLKLETDFKHRWNKCNSKKVVTFLIEFRQVFCRGGWRFGRSWPCWHNMITTTMAKSQLQYSKIWLKNRYKLHKQNYNKP